MVPHWKYLFFQGLKCCFFFFGQKGGRSTRILHLKKEIVLFCFKYCDGEKRCGCYVHCIGRLSYMAICYLQQECRESRTIAHCLTRKKKCLDSYYYFFLFICFQPFTLRSHGPKPVTN